MLGSLCHPPTPKKEKNQLTFGTFWAYGKLSLNGPKAGFVTPQMPRTCVELRTEGLIICRNVSFPHPLKIRQWGRVGAFSLPGIEPKIGLRRHEFYMLHNWGQRVWCNVQIRPPPNLIQLHSKSGGVGRWVRLTWAESRLEPRGAAVKFGLLLLQHESRPRSSYPSPKLDSAMRATSRGWRTWNQLPLSSKLRFIWMSLHLILPIYLKWALSK